MTTRTLLCILVGASLALAACDDQGSGIDDPWDPTKEKPDPVDPKIPTMDDCEADAVFAGQSQMRLLTRYEYDNTVNDLLNIEVDVASKNFPPENAVGGFENNSDSHVVSPLLVRDMMEAAEDIAALAVRAEASVVPCDTQDLACGEMFVTALLPRAFRRPASLDETQIYNALFASALEVYDFDTSVEITIEAILQSPQFLYKIELADNLAPGALVKLSSYEVASRLSYMLWGTMPDRGLFEAAAADELQTKEQVEAQVSRMVGHPKAEQGIWHFYRQWLALDELDTATKDATQFPTWDPSLLGAWKTSIYDYVTWIHRSHPTVEDLMTSNTVFLDDNLATFYGETPRGDSAQFSMSRDERAGLLTQPGVMALLSNSNQGSPILRGIFVREQVLCQKLPPPPDDIQIDPPDPDPNGTTREVFEQHAADAACAGCHKMIDPIGLGFENYDGVGQYRKTENGNPVDASGGLFNTADSTLEGDFDGAVQLTTRLSGAAEVRDCFADKWITYASGQPELRADMCSGFGIRTKFAETGRFEDLFVAIATSDMFRYRTVQVLAEDETE